LGEMQKPREWWLRYLRLSPGFEYPISYLVVVNGLRVISRASAKRDFQSDAVVIVRRLPWATSAINRAGATNTFAVGTFCRTWEQGGLLVRLSEKRWATAPTRSPISVKPNRSTRPTGPASNSSACSVFDNDPAGRIFQRDSDVMLGILRDLGVKPSE